jgi:hypothetical protein
MVAPTSRQQKVDFFAAKPRNRWLAAGLLVIVTLIVAGWIWTQIIAEQPREAPEAEAVLQAQTSMPFQILIPAYLPAGFQRKNVEIQTNLTDPQGQPMVQLVYTHPLGVRLTLSEWVLPDFTTTGQANNTSSNVQRCNCLCQDHNRCSANRFMVDIGSLRISGESSDPLILSPEHIRVILTTLAPAGGLTTYSFIEKVPIAAGLPPAEEVTVNASGVQEVVLVVTSNGYTPVHFSVKKDAPVRVVFRQLGEVGCGNELYFAWGANQSGQLILSGSSESQVLEFTPREPGDFLFHCPHFIYQGVMTVID